MENFSGTGTERDKTFDVLMGRFDRLNQDRDAVKSILKASCTDPKQLVIGMPNVARSMAWMLEACEIETQGWRGALRVAVRAKRRACQWRGTAGGAVSERAVVGV